MELRRPSGDEGSTDPHTFRGEALSVSADSDIHKGFHNSFPVGERSTAGLCDIFSKFAGPNTRNFYPKFSISLAGNSNSR